ncbi:MAG: hypothetical protein CMO40_05385 [Verrucomicrobiaceae bacterium]|nr:hypothetical protein [Verrucomicrobiaceae bacterium]
MNTEPSDKFEELKGLLAQSFHSEEADDVPSLPEALRDRIQDQYGRELTPSPRPTEVESQSLFSKISRLFVQPQFSGALAAVVLMAVAAFLLIPERSETPPPGIRGDDPVAPSNPAATIILYGFESGKAEAIKTLLDPSVAVIKEDISGEPVAEGATIIIDGRAAEIQGYAGPGAEATVVALPENESEVSKAVAELLLQVTNE